MTNRQNKRLGLALEDASEGVKALQTAQAVKEVLPTTTRKKQLNAIQEGIRMFSSSLVDLKTLERELQIEIKNDTKRI